MRFNNIIFFTLLALGLAAPVTVDERDVDVSGLDKSLSEEVARDLLPRGIITITSGLREATAADSIETYGLATCPGMAASGTAGPSGINKVMGHINCSPNPSQYRDATDMMDQWVQRVRNSGMTNLVIVIDILDPSVVPRPLQAAQQALNQQVRNYAQSLGAGYVTTTRHEMASPPPSGTLAILNDGAITIGGFHLAGPPR